MWTVLRDSEVPIVRDRAVVKSKGRNAIGSGLGGYRPNQGGACTMLEVGSEVN